jgi:aspartyl-tRNA(Asn)/glutamyl-tRNA(Gln) amidotransferase subunit B
VPLLEIVSEPDMHSSEEAFAYLTELRKLVSWLDVCDGNMEEGSMRCDANISIRLTGEKKLGTRVEVKNLNSIRNVKRAIDTEVERLIGITERGEKIIQETRSYDAGNNSTFSLRTKEEADDYRYFPEPDLAPFFVTDEFLKQVEAGMPVLPAALIKRYVEEFNLSSYDASVICDDKEQSEYFEKLIQHTNNYKAAANWMLGPVKSHLNDNHTGWKEFNLPAEKIASLIGLVEEGKLGFGIASSKVFQELIKYPGKDPLQVAAELNLLQENDGNFIEGWVNEVIGKMPDKVKQYKTGKKGLIGLFAGEVKRLSKGKADMQIVNKLLEEKLNDQ